MTLRINFLLRRWPRKQLLPTSSRWAKFLTCYASHWEFYTGSIDELNSTTKQITEITARSNKATKWYNRLEAASPSKFSSTSGSVVHCSSIQWSKLNNNLPHCMHELFENVERNRRNIVSYLVNKLNKLFPVRKPPLQSFLSRSSHAVFRSGCLNTWFRYLMHLRNR